MDNINMQPVYKREIDGDELFRRIAGHSYYHGDDILTRISLMQEGKLPKKKDIKPADVVPLEKYNHLLKLAKAMHTWIFLHTSDEQKAYDECHLTDEDNAMLGYGGQFIITEGGQIKNET